MRGEFNEVLLAKENLVEILLTRIELTLSGIVLTTIILLTWGIRIISIPRLTSAIEIETNLFFKDLIGA